MVIVYGNFDVQTKKKMASSRKFKKPDIIRKAYLICPKFICPKCPTIKLMAPE